MTMLVRSSRFRAGADTAIGLWLGDEQRGLAIDFLTMEAVVRDDDAPVGSFYGAPSALLTNTTPPTKMLFNAAGVLTSGSNMRTDYDPITLQPKGLVIEGVGTNTAIHSQNFSAWAPAEVTVSSDVAVAPDGTTTADKIVETTLGGSVNRLLYGSFTGTAAAWTLSVYAKAAERSWLYLRLDLAGPLVGAFFNLSTGVVGTVEAGIIATIHPAGNGWYRCSVTRTLTAVLYYYAIAETTGDTIKAHVGDGVSGLYIWGGQLELGGIPTSYIPTTTASATRATDNIFLIGASLPVVPGVGTLLVEFLITYGNQANCPVMELTRSASGEQSRVHAYAIATGSNMQALMKDSTGATSAGITFTTLPVGVVRRIAQTWADNDFAASVTGRPQQTDTSGTAPTTHDKLFVHAHYLAAGGHKHIRKIKYLPRRVTNAELEAMVV
jgi:hypothetical protein